MSPSSELRAQISKLTDAISVLENRAAVFRAKKQELEAALAKISYPILSIPPEITSEIFVCGTSSLDKFDNWPLVVAGVCRQWRQIALSTPSLWNNFVHILADSATDPGNLLKTWIARSGALPLNVSLQCSISAQDTKAALAPLCSEVLRWRSVVLEDIICHDHHDEGLGFAGDEPEPTPLLALHGRMPLHDVEQNSWPALRSLTLCRHTTIEDGLLSTRTLAPLTNLTLTDALCRDIFLILSETPLLEVLTVKLPNGSLSWAAPPPEPGDWPTQPIRLAHLRKLHSNVEDLLAYLSLPALKVFCVGLVPPTADTVLPFILRSGCTLETLLIHDIFNQAVLPSVAPFSSVRMLRIHMVGFVDEEDEVNLVVFLRAFGRGDVFPRVDHLSFVKVEAADVGFVAETLGSVLQPREMAAAALTIWFVVEGELDEVDGEAIMQLRDSEMVAQVDIRSSTEM
ncbi:F-box domain-containing protein [Mycena kentingensis (nom. inval.)]|nr:F-box domain-containing protein [Mycena kentingensis (nom. inval.)]